MAFPGGGPGADADRYLLSARVRADGASQRIGDRYDRGLGQFDGADRLYAHRDARRPYLSAHHRARHDHAGAPIRIRSEEHTSELQSLMRISYAVLCLKKKNQIKN